MGCERLAVRVCSPRLMKKVSAEIENKIKKLRKKGLSHREIARVLKIGLGTAVNYSREITLTSQQKQLLRKKGYQKSIAKLSISQRRDASLKGGLNNIKNLHPKYSKPQLLYMLKDFYQRNSRVPTKKDFAAHYGSFVRIFGAWNIAIKEAGLSPNPVLFAKKHYANDGHKCDSLAEKIIDDWLFSRNIQHERNIHYFDTKFTADFKIGDTFIEFFGLHGQLKRYDVLMRKKMKLIQQHNLKLISIFPNDIFPTLQLDSILKGL